MVTPYDWQENLGHRVDYVTSRLAAGIPIAAASVPEGIVLATFRSRTRKLFEIYDRIVYAGLGLQSDVETVRIAAIEFSHQEGYRRSEDDVTVQRVVTHLSTPLKTAFGDPSTSPVVFRGLFGQVGDTPAHDRYYILDFDGDYDFRQGVAFATGSREALVAMVEAVEGVDFATASLSDALAQLRESVLKGMDPDGSKAAEGALPELVFEAALMERASGKTRRFRHLEGLPE